MTEAYEHTPVGAAQIDGRQSFRTESPTTGVAARRGNETRAAPALRSPRRIPDPGQKRQDCLSRRESRAGVAYVTPLRKRISPTCGSADPLTARKVATGHATPSSLRKRPAIRLTRKRMPRGIASPGCAPNPPVATGRRRLQAQRRAEKRHSNGSALAFRVVDGHPAASRQARGTRDETRPCCPLSARICMLGTRLHGSNTPRIPLEWIISPALNTH